MWDMDSNVFSSALVLAVSVVMLAIVSCDQASTEASRELQLSQKWELQPGDVVAGHQDRKSVV